MDKFNYIEHRHEFYISECNCIFIKKSLIFLSYKNDQHTTLLRVESSDNRVKLSYHVEVHCAI